MVAKDAKVCRVSMVIVESKVKMVPSLDKVFKVFREPRV